MFKKNTLLRALMAAGLTTGLVACGGGGSGSGGSDSSGNSVRAIDGYLVNANIYIDANENGMLDPSEKASKVGVTDSEGFIQVPDEAFKGQLLVEAVAGQTIDSDSGAISETFVLTAPQGSAYITPFTHLAQTTGKSYADLAKDLGVPESVVSGDYIAAQDGSNAENAKNAEIAHAVARFIVKETTKETKIETISSNLIAAKEKIVERVELGEDPALVEVELAETGAIVDAEPSRLIFSKTELEDTTWTMLRFDDAGDNEQMFLQLGTTNYLDSFCIVNEGFSYLNGDPSITHPDKDTCSDGDFEVTDSGTLKMMFKEDSEVAEFTVLYRNKETVGSDEVQTFVMVSDAGELFWLDSNPELEDLGDYVITENNTRYIFADDDGDRGGIEYVTGERQFTITGSETYSVSGEDKELSKGTILFGMIGSPNLKGSFDSVPAHDLEKASSGGDDVLVVRENESEESHLHHHFIFRSSGDLELMLDYKTEGNSENLYLQSSNRALIESIAREVEARDSGQQGK